MARRAPWLCLLLTVACPAPSTSDAGSGGGSGGVGGGTAGSAGGGSAGGGSAGGGSAGIPLASYCAAFGAALCDLAVRCGEVSPQGCPRYIADTFPSDCLGNRSSLLDAGALLYDGVRAQQCFAELAAGPCSTRTLQASPSCRGAFQGTRPVGQPCYQSECVLAAWCDSTAGTCPGTCRRDVDPGTAPPSSAACPDGTFSVGGEPCSQLVPLGGDCSNGTSFFDKLCAVGAWCEQLGDGGRVCRPFIDAGSPCPGALASDLSGACSFYALCLPGPDGGNVCAPHASTGQSCTAGCQVGLACSATDGGGTCGPAHAAGGDCRADGECALPLACVRTDFFTPGTCQMRGGVDAGCLLDKDCQSALRCSGNGNCVTPTQPGQPCISGGCVSGYTCDADAGCVRTFCLPP